MRNRRFLFHLLFRGVIPALLIPALAGASPGASLRLDHGGYLVERAGKVLLAHNPDLPLAPASILKIATALAAFHLLGPDYHFSTRFFLDRSGNLYIKGLGDPGLVSEEISRIAARLRQKGLRSVRDIVLDDTAFDLESAADGAGRSLNPYDVLNSALAVNFNTVNIRVSRAGEVTSAEPQTPALPLMTELARGLPPGIHRINICTEPANVTRYAGELFAAIFRAHRIKVLGRTRTGRVPGGLPLFHEHRSSRGLADIIRALLRYSNNFIANQIFLTCGARISDYPATWAKARRGVNRFFQDRFGFEKGNFFMMEGSGLSRKNRVTARVMARIVAAFKSYAGLLPEHDGLRVKSGTLTGVYSYAGYFRKNGRLDPFVLILNQKENCRDQLLDRLRREYLDRASF